MRRLLQINLLLWGLLLTHQTLWAQQEEVFKETFDKCNGTGGTDNIYGDDAGSGDVGFNNEGWTFDKCGGANQCIKYGTGSANCTLSTPHISLKEGTTATMTFKVAGWKKNPTDNTKNKLAITAEGCKVSGDISLNINKNDKAIKNGEWTTYTVDITDITEPVVITFTGRRGFIDDVVIVGEPGGEIVVKVPEPTLTDEFTFWPKTVEPTKRIVTITPATDTRTRYTLDGSEPSLTEGTEITAPTSLFIWGTTTVKAISTKSLYTSDVVTKTYTLGEPVNSLTEFTALTDGAEAQIFLSAEQNARIIAVNDKQFTVKDDAGKTVLFDFGDVAFDPQPAVQQHIAGWIIGKKLTADDKTTFVATTNTTPKYLAFANRVTEPDVTSIKAITNQLEAKGNTYYNLSGQRVMTPKKGLYIVNGKKLIIH